MQAENSNTAAASSSSLPTTTTNTNDPSLYAGPILRDIQISTGAHRSLCTAFVLMVIYTLGHIHVPLTASVMIDRYEGTSSDAKNIVYYCWFGEGYGTALVCAIIYFAWRIDRLRSKMAFLSLLACIVVLIVGAITAIFTVAQNTERFEYAALYPELKLISAGFLAYACYTVKDLYGQESGPLLPQ